MGTVDVWMSGVGVVVPVNSFTSCWILFGTNVFLLVVLGN